MLFNRFGLTHYDQAKAMPGYTLFATVNHDQANLLSMEGEIVHQWQLQKGGINHGMLLPNGNLFIAEGSEDGPPIPAGKGGMLREYDWDSNIVWEHHDENQHHDARRLPNGNTVYIAWKKMTPEEASRIKGGLAGTENSFNAGGPFQDVIREVDPAGNVVFEWQSTELDMDKYQLCPLCKRHEWAHANTCAPLPNGDIMVSYRVLNLLIIIDRQTGKIKWEYQEPELGHQHDCQMLDNGNILVFCNGMHGRDLFFSRILEFDPDSKATKWEYRGTPALSFYSPHISGMQRLENGNTLICEGGKGCIFEVTPAGEVVWEYVSDIWTHNPVMADVNWIFRAYRYAVDSPQIQNRV